MHCGAPTSWADADIVVSTPSGEATLVVAPSTIWTTRQVPVCFMPDPANVDTSALRPFVRQGAAKWEQASAVTFVGWGTCDGTHSGVQVGFYDSGNAATVGWSYIGMESKGLAPSLSLTRTRLEGVQLAMVATHEFGHALGFYHEQVRMDTPGSCIQSDARTADSSLVSVGVYDPNSIMNYCNPTWANNGVLSATDTIGVRQYYGAPAASTSSTSTTGGGSGGTSGGGRVSPGGSGVRPPAVGSASTTTGGATETPTSVPGTDTAGSPIHAAGCAAVDQTWIATLAAILLILQRLKGPPRVPAPVKVRPTRRPPKRAKPR